MRETRVIRRLYGFKIGEYSGKQTSLPVDVHEQVWPRIQSAALASSPVGGIRKRAFASDLISIVSIV